MKSWYKILSVILILYTIVWGLLGSVPRLDILNETIRNVFYHVPIWFAMLFLMSVSLFFSIKALMSNSLHDDSKAYDSALVGFFFSIPGIITGSVWAKYTWGTWWTFQDPKLNGVAISILIYTAYFILRSSVDDEQKRAKISAVYNVFAFVMMNVFIMVLPRLTDSLHPGNGGNPAFAKYDMDNGMRMVFYPAVIGWILFSFWIFEIKNRISVLKNKLND
ncbi:MAG: cytochrome c biogenesis protein CcsA [Bacteroidetes bacterium]|nr:cytochrome c biogenesis protein CcsA [Bacteroidota bacterium]